MIELVTDDLLKEFKGRNHISHKSEDGDLKKLLSLSIAYAESKFGELNFDEKSNVGKRAREIVLERTRYAYNDAVEFFEDNFLSDILSLQFDILFSKEGEPDAEV